MTRFQRLLAPGLVVLGLVVGLGVALVPSASADAATAGPGHRTTRVHAVLLGDTDQGGSGVRRAIRPWRGRTISYYDALPAAWSWSATRAFANWNQAGGRIRFVPTTNARRARLRVSFGNTYGATGMATVGARKKAWVHLSPSFATASTTDAWNRVAVMEVLTHELGHVLGFEHVSTRCALMNPVIDVDGCGMLPADRPGYYKCQVIDGTLEQAFVRSYAGRARYATSTYCLLDPLPAPVSGVQASTDSSSDVHVTWTPPAYAPAGSRVRVQTWGADTCGAAPVDAASIDLPIGQTSFGYVPGPDGGQVCLVVSAVNRYGAASAVTTRTLARVAPATGSSSS